MLAVICQVEGGVNAGGGPISLVHLSCHVVRQRPQHVACMAHGQLQGNKKAETCKGQKREQLDEHK